MKEVFSKLFILILLLEGMSANASQQSTPAFSNEEISSIRLIAEQGDQDINS